MLKIVASIEIRPNETCFDEIPVIGFGSLISVWSASCLEQDVGILGRGQK